MRIFTFKTQLSVFGVLSVFFGINCFLLVSVEISGGHSGATSDMHPTFHPLHQAQQLPAARCLRRLLRVCSAAVHRGPGAGETQPIRVPGPPGLPGLLGEVDVLWGGRVNGWVVQQVVLSVQTLFSSNLPTLLAL